MWRSRRRAGLARGSLATVLAGAGLLAPAAAPTVRAADGLDIKADTTDRVDVDDAVVRVRIDVMLTDRTPNRTTSAGAIQDDRRGRALAAAGASTTLAATPVPGAFETMTVAPASPIEPPPVAPFAPPPDEPPPTVPAPGADAD